MEPAFDTARFKKKAAAALSDARLGGTLKAFQARLQMGRAFAKAGLPEFEALRDLGRDIKDDAIARLPDLLERFEAAVTARGGQVHWARDGLEARAIVLRIAQDAKARTVVKSKSMVSEEIDLGAALERAGLRSIETDLGEYIVQLRGERPSHMIGPAAHLSRAQVEETFRRAHDTLPPGRDIAECRALVAEARERLRREFAAADIGITGANFLLAEEGAALLVTNEGNADLTAALPKIHIVLTGIEKVVPGFEEAAVLLRLLARSATGQDFSAYTTLFTGPRQEGETDGPDRFHVVLLDNGRSGMIGTPFQEALRCIRCAACLNHCPVFGAIGGHGYGSVYPGPIGSVLSPALVGIDAARDLPEASTLCGRCEEVCPVRIPLPRMLRHWREREFERHLAPMPFRWGIGLWSFLAAGPARFALAARLARRGLAILAAKDGWIHKLPGAAGGWSDTRDLKIPKGRSFQDAWGRGERR